MIIEVHGHAQQGAGFGSCGVRGLNALLATVTTASAPVIIGQRLRRGGCGSPRGARRMVADALTTTRRLLEPGTRVLLRADSAFYAADAVPAALTGGADVSITVWLGSKVREAIADIAPDAWTTIATRTRSSTRPPGRGSPGPRSPRSATPRSPPRATQPDQGRAEADHPRQDGHRHPPHPRPQRDQRASPRSASTSTSAGTRSGAK